MGMDRTDVICKVRAPDHWEGGDSGLWGKEDYLGYVNSISVSFFIQNTVIAVRYIYSSNTSVVFWLYLP